MAKKTRSKAGAKSKKRGTSGEERYRKALDGLERAMKALHKDDPERAKELLLKLQESYPEERELMDRVHSYLHVCERRLSPQRRPKSAEEMATYGVMFFNEGDSQQAIKYLTKALEMEPRSTHIQYCLAAAHARTGDATASAKHLKQAIQGDPTSRIHARRDVDFDGVREAQEIASLLAAT